MKVVAIALVLLQASLHSCRSYNKATPQNDTETTKPVKLPPKLIQILESLDSPDAKITKIKELIPVYNDFPEFRVKSNKKHLFMPYKKKGKPLAYILKKAYLNEIVSEHTDESFSFEDVENNERIHKSKPTSYRNTAYYPSSQNEKKPEKPRKYNYSNIPEIHILVDGDVKDEPEIYDYDQYNKNKPEVENSAELIEELIEPIIVLPAEHKHVHHTHRHNIVISEEKAKAVSNSEKDYTVVTEVKHNESKHHHHGHSSKDSQLFQSEVQSDDTDSDREQINQKVTEDKPIDLIPEGDKIEKELDHIQAINVHKHHHQVMVNSEEKAEAVSNSEKDYAVVTEVKHNESKHHHHGHSSKDSQLFQSEVQSDDTDSDREQIHQKITDDKPIDSIPEGDKIEKELDNIQAINVHKHHHHQQPVVSIAAVASTDDNHLQNIVTTKHGHHTINLGEENLNPDDLKHHKVAHHTEDPHHLVKIDADELHSDKIDTVDTNATVDTNTTELSNEKKHLHSHSHSTHHHSYHKESVNDIDKYISYLTELDLASPNTNEENNLKKSNDTVIEAILNDTNWVSKEYNNNASDFNGIVPGITELTKNQVALSDGKLDSHISDFSASAYYSDEFGSGKLDDASGSSEHSSESIDSVSDSNQESTTTDENISTASSESENTSIYSNELETNESNSYSDSNSAFNSKSLEFDLLLPAIQSESGPELNESDITGLEELPSEASNLISESIEVSSESDSTNLSDESNPSQSNESNDNLVSVESQSSELSDSKAIISSEIGLNSISGSDYSVSASENDSKSDISSSSGSGYLSQSESEESSESDSAGSNLSNVSKESIIESSENRLHSTVILDTTILSESNSISSASDSSSQESYLEPNPSDINLVLEESYSSLNANAASSEASISNLETVLSTETNSSNVESNASSVENRVRSETTALNSSSAATEKSTDSSLITASIVETPVPDLETSALYSSYAAIEKSTDSSLITASIVETRDLESIASSLMSSASSLKSVASNLEASALNLISVPGLECIGSKLNTTASKLVYDALNLETSAMSLKWGSGLNLTALNLMACTESTVRPDLSTVSSAILAPNSEPKSSDLESLPSFESISPIIEKSPSSPAKFKAFYSTIQSSINNNVRRAEGKDSKETPVIENNISNGKKTYSMSFVFNK